MAQTVESQYKELLNPVKDPQKSFEINIAELLENYISNLYEGKFAPNFNSAALLLQGSASIYVKKVEYLHDLATQLYNRLIKQKTEEQQKQLQQQSQQNPKKEQKEKKKEEVLDDPFAPVEIKLGKNLSCFKRKSTKILLKNNDKKDKVNSIPVYLLSVDGEDNGGPFYDVRGEVIGNKADFALNKCFITAEGFLVLPTVSLKLVPSPDTTPDYYNDSDSYEKITNNDAGTPAFTENMDDDDDIHMSPDDGIGASYPESNTIPESTPGTDINSQNTDTPSQGTTLPSTDEGIGSTPADDIPSSLSSGNTEGNENVPTGNTESSDPALMPVRHSIRQALKQCQLAQEDDPLASATDKNLLVRKKIQKKNTRSLPNKLKMPGEEGEAISISEYCARTFFSMDTKNLKNSLLAFDVSSFDQNSKFMKKIIEKIDALKSSSRKNKKVDAIEDEKEIDVEGIECLKDTDEGDDGLCVPFDDGDVRIDNDPVIPEPENNGPPIEDAPAEVPTPEISHIAPEECQNYLDEINQFVQNSDITERVHEWEKNVKPFLDQMDKRESFDINLYGSRILNAFEDNNRKQTMTFRQFCENKEKWEIHRYFMALLPLANIGNVSIEPELKADGTEEIFVTLLSRKMHHKELEEFGHNDGSHS